MLTKTKKEKLVKGTQVHDKDTGSPEVQIAILSKRIEELSAHLKNHHKDKHSRRGLLQMVADRHSLSKYLKKKSQKRFAAIAKKVGLKVK
jgi:small subunit ribosomal protein S15